MIAGERIVDEPRWWTALLVIALLAGSNHWTTAGLPSAEIDDAMLEPLDGAAPTLEAARETAPFTLWVLLIAGLAMTVLQLYVLVTHGVWWSWLGAVMFLLASGVMARQLLRLRTENRVSSARSE